MLVVAGLQAFLALFSFGILFGLAESEMAVPRPLADALGVLMFPAMYVADALGNDFGGTGTILGFAVGGLFWGLLAALIAARWRGSGTRRGGSQDGPSET